MIKHYNGFKAEKTGGSNEPLPVGGYVAKILGAEIKDYSWGQVLVLSYDIAEGAYKDFFANKYRSDTRDDKKWKGTYRINVPREDSQYAETEKRDFNNMIWAFEESNSGFRFDWDESKFKGKAVGVIIREKEYYINGKFGVTTECGKMTSVDDIRNNTFAPMKLKKLSRRDKERMEAEQGTAQTENNGFTSLDDTDGELPF